LIRNSAAASVSKAAISRACVGGQSELWLVISTFPGPAGGRNAVTDARSAALSKKDPAGLVPREDPVHRRHRIRVRILLLSSGAKGTRTLTPCLQTTGSTSTHVHTRRSPSPGVLPHPARSAPVAVLCCFPAFPASVPCRGTPRPRRLTLPAGTHRPGHSCAAFPATDMITPGQFPRAHAALTRCAQGLTLPATWLLVPAARQLRARSSDVTARRSQDLVAPRHDSHGPGDNRPYLIWRASSDAQ